MHFSRRNRLHKGTGGPAFDLDDTTKTVGAPFFALFEGRVPRARTARDFAQLVTDITALGDFSPSALQSKKQIIAKAKACNQKSANVT